MSTSEWIRRGHLLVSPALSALGLVAGFTTRALGSMGGAGTPARDAERARAALAARLGFAEVVRVRQVHGSTVLRVPFVRPGPASPSPAGPPAEAWPEADALWTDRFGALLGVVAADCVPVLVADPQGRIGAAHAGWRGTTLEVTRRLVAEMRRAGSDPRAIVAALGPSIGPCCYQVDEDRAAVVRERLGAAAERAIRPYTPSRGPAGAEPRPSLVFDLWTANADQLRAEGVDAIEVAGTCTRCGGEDLWSHRGRDRGGVGLGMAVIGRPS